MAEATIQTTKPAVPIYGSALTLEKIAGIRVQMADLAGKPIIIVNRDELVVFKNGLNYPASLMERSRLADDMVDWKKSGQRLKDFFKASVAPDVAASFMQAYSSTPSKPSAADYIHAVKEIVRSQGPYAEHNARPDGVGLIRAPDHSMSVADHVSGLTKIPPHFLTNFVGTAGDYNAIIMLHEAKHLAQPVSNGHESLPFEVDADRGGISGYRSAIAAGTPLHKDVPEVMGLLREVGSLPQMGSEIYTMLKSVGMSPTGRIDGRDTEKANTLPSHSTHAFLAGEKEEDAFSDSATQKFLAMQRVKSFVNVMVGQQDMTDQFNKLQARLAQPGANVTDQDIAFVQRGAGVGSIFEMHNVGALAINDDPAKGYNAIKALHQSKFFKEGSEEARYVGRVNSFLETYAPTYISEPDTVAARQALVTSLGQIKEMGEFPVVEPSSPENTSQPRSPALPRMGR